MYQNNGFPATYDHRLKGIGHPVRSAIHKLQIGRLVVGWVTTSEYLLLYVFLAFFGSRLGVEKRFLGETLWVTTVNPLSTRLFSVDAWKERDFCEK
jgi:hypothetical protein